MSEDKESRSFFTSDEDRDSRLDLFLTRVCPDLSRSRIQKALDADCALVDGVVRPSRYRLTAGKRVDFTPPPPPPSRAEPEDIPLDIVHQDESILVINKPVGMVVHPAPAHMSGTLVNALLHRFQNLPGGEGLRPGIVHRLDKDTSGLMVVALNEQAHRSLSAQLKDRTLGRLYKTLSWGQWSRDESVLAGDLGRHPRHRQRMAVVPTGGRSAVTHYSVLEDFGFCQFCEVRLETGRTHQIRVHFAANGHPVFGDSVYGDDARVKQVHPLDLDAARAVLKSCDRQLLHAARLSLRHPDHGTEMVFDSSLPDDLAGALDILRLHCSRR